MNEETIFQLALEKASGERASLLDGACAGDLELRQRVESLLQAHEQPGSFLAKPAEGVATLADPSKAGNSQSAIGEGPGTRIGPYKLLQRLGEGGMGVVYLAEQERPVRRRVALKIIKLGLDSAQVIARFEQERQALAMMLLTALRELTECCATLDHAVHMLQQERNKPKKFRRTACTRKEINS
jgi:serine/threonine protein kinase